MPPNSYTLLLLKTINGRPARTSSDSLFHILWLKTAFRRSSPDITFLRKMCWLAKDVFFKDFLMSQSLCKIVDPLIHQEWSGVVNSKGGKIYVYDRMIIKGRMRGWNWNYWRCTKQKSQNQAILSRYKQYACFLKGRVRRGWTHEKMMAYFSSWFLLNFTAEFGTNKQFYISATQLSLK